MSAAALPTAASLLLLELLIEWELELRLELQQELDLLDLLKRSA